MERGPPSCPLCTGTASVVVAVTHHTLRQLIVDLLEQDHASWEPHALADRGGLAALVTAARPDLVVLDDGNLAWCRELFPVFSPQRVIVIGPEPDVAYKRAARRAGAGAWLTRDRVGEDLITCMRTVLGCMRDPCSDLAAVPQGRHDGPRAPSPR